MKRVLLTVLLASSMLLAACGSPTAEKITITTTPATTVIPTTPITTIPITAAVSNQGYIYENGAILVGGDSEPIQLINNPSATDPTFAELLAFIEADSTDKEPYISSVSVFMGYAEVSFVCADFAEALHNNAEAAGIRAAWVGIDFEDGGDGHALNAFETIDNGLVFIDSQGEDSLDRTLRQISQITIIDGQLSSKKHDPLSWDKVAYVEIGREYGLIAIAVAESLSYSFYEEYTQKWQEYDNALEAYNREVQEYNQEIAGNIYNEGSSELARIEAWEARLIEESQMIDKLGKDLAEFWFEPLGIVKDIYIHW